MLRNIPRTIPWQWGDEARRVGGGREADQRQWSGDIAPPSWLEGPEDSDSDCSDVSFFQSSQLVLDLTLPPTFRPAVFQVVVACEDLQGWRRSGMGPSGEGRTSSWPLIAITRE